MYIACLNVLWVANCWIFLFILKDQLSINVNLGVTISTYFFILPLRVRALTPQIPTNEKLRNVSEFWTEKKLAVSLNFPTEDVEEEQQIHGMISASIFHFHSLS